ncbi:protein kilB [Streptomyces sp. NPDC090109]|uniref:protein kilB n=1 Tax=Streptomyces sp. NPDC090109 TaxID=3365948 RepID=UPI003830423F
MLATTIAVLGTLAGALLTGALAHLTSRAQLQAVEKAAHRREALTALAALHTALADHRLAMWVREDLRLQGKDWTAARDASHATRSAINSPLLYVSVLLPALAPAAQEAARATYALRGADDENALQAAREHAIDAVDRLVAAAATALAA